MLLYGAARYICSSGDEEGVLGSDVRLTIDCTLLDYSLWKNREISGCP